MQVLGLALLIFTISISIYVCQDVSAHHVMEEIPVSASPMGMSLADDRLYVSSFGYPHIDIVDLEAQENVGFITTSSSGIMDVAVVPDKNKIYTASFESGKIDTYTLSTRLPIDTIPLSESEFTFPPSSSLLYGHRSDIHYITGGWDLEYSPVEDLLYVANYNSHVVSVIDAKTDKVVETISVPRHPFAIKADQITGIVLVASLAGNEITILEDVTDELAVRPFHEAIKTIKVTGGPWGIAIDSETSKAYVANRGCECLTVIDLVNKEIIGSIPLGDKAQAIAVDSTEHQIYVSYLSQNKIVKIDGETNQIVSSQVISSPIWGIEVNEKTHKIYASLKDENKLLVLGPQSKSFSMPVVTLQSPSAYVGMVNLHGQDVDLMGAVVNLENYSLDMTIDTDDGGRIAIDIPRDVLDSKQDGSDVPFEVTIDKTKVDFTESINDNKRRVISVLVPKDSEIISIKGNKAVQAMTPVEDSAHESIPMSPSRIICEGKVWVENTKGRIACVTPSTAEKLVERGWGNYLD
ncbi:MAG: YncE family protein [Nitrosopumilaceae archaeon]